jgi:hypothetical protein
MDRMTKKEMKAMEGTEFLFKFSSEDTMKAYVKKVDIEKAMLSCWSLSLTTDKGRTLETMDENEEKEGACCLIAVMGGIRRTEVRLKIISSVLKSIKENGSYGDMPSLFGFPGCPF